MGCIVIIAVKMFFKTDDHLEPEVVAAFIVSLKFELCLENSVLHFLAVSLVSIDQRFDLLLACLQEFLRDEKKKKGYCKINVKFGWFEPTYSGQCV